MGQGIGHVVVDGDSAHAEREEGREAGRRYNAGAETTGVAATLGASEKRCRRAPQPPDAGEGGLGFRACCGER